MKKFTEKDAILLLKKYSRDEDSFNKVLNHAKAVQKVALRIAERIPGVDKHFISIASLLHDIGRFDCWKKDIIKHGLHGGDILRKEGLDDHALVAERHLGAGISKENINEQRLDLPDEDFEPVSKEEKIITHADNLIKGDKETSIADAIERYEKELGVKVAEKVRRLAEEVEAM